MIIVLYLIEEDYFLYDVPDPLNSSPLNHDFIITIFIQNLTTTSLPADV